MRGVDQESGLGVLTICPVISRTIYPLPSSIGLGREGFETRSILHTIVSHINDVPDPSVSCSKSTQHRLSLAPHGYARTGNPMLPPDMIVPKNG